jgi:phosphohistidine swiveling domain-containing protein
MGLYLRHPDIADLRMRFSDAQAEEYMDIYLAHRSRIDKVADDFLAGRSELEHENEDYIARELAKDPKTLDNSELLESYDYILRHLRSRSVVDFDTAAHLAFYYTQLLAQKVAAHPTVETERMGSVLSVLAQGLEGSAVTEANLAIWSASDVEVAYSMAAKLIGHYQVEGEIMEIRRPRLIDSSETLRHYVHALRSGDNYREVFERQKSERLSLQEELLSALEGDARHDFADTMTRAQRYLTLRETLKDRITREYVPLRRHLIEIGTRAGLDEGDVFYLYPNEVQSLMEDATLVRHLINARKIEHNLERKLTMPSVLRHDRVDDISYESARAKEFTEADGQLIAAGRPVEGVVVNLDQAGHYAEAMSLLDSLRADGHSVILVAKVMNLTHDPYLNKAEGLILESAGFASHGAQRARELGVGALSGIDTARLRTGMRVSFDTDSGVVRNLNENEP